MDECPQCGAALNTLTVLCIECGYDLEKGRKFDEPQAEVEEPQVDPSAWPYTASYALGTTLAVTIGLAIWFCWAEIDSSGMSVSLALLCVSGLFVGIGLFLSTLDKVPTVSNEERMLGGFASAGALANGLYVGLFFSSWIVIILLWLLVHAALMVSLWTSPSD